MFQVVFYDVKWGIDDCMVSHKHGPMDVEIIGIVPSPDKTSSLVKMNCSASLQFVSTHCLDKLIGVTCVIATALAISNCIFLYFFN